VPVSSTTPSPAPPAPSRNGAISSYLTPDRVVIWNDPPSRDELFTRLVQTITGGATPAAQSIIDRLREREKTGSTFLNEGVALPHARLESLTRPEIALGLTHAGVLDSPADKPIEVVFMLLSPAEGPNVHLQLLSRAGRMLQSRELRRRLARIEDPAAALQQIAEWERANGSTQ
jgi:mannitol/fructose-specific phosphotransferase system IIA component (Ntr-type)